MAYLVSGRWWPALAKKATNKFLGPLGFAYDLFRAEGTANAIEAELLAKCGNECFGGPSIPSGGSAALSTSAAKALSSQAKKIIELSPDELVATELPDPSRVAQIERSMIRSGEFYSSKPVKFFENNGTKLIVDGHHRTKAATNVGLKVKAIQVDESYLLKRFGGTADDFIMKALKFAGKIK